MYTYASRSLEKIGNEVSLPVCIDPLLFNRWVLKFKDFQGFSRTVQ